VIAVDTNVLVYAHRDDAVHHAAARAALEQLVESDEEWAIAWPCMHEFLAIVTHPRIYAQPTPAREAVAAIVELIEATGVRLLGEGPNHLALLAEVLNKSGVVGPRIHDARIAAICLTHGVRELWTADRDFSYFSDLTTHNPLVQART
jgi:uncharacterized protein